MSTHGETQPVSIILRKGTFGSETDIPHHFDAVSGLIPDVPGRNGSPSPERSLRGQPTEGTRRNPQEPGSLTLLPNVTLRG